MLKENKDKDLYKNPRSPVSHNELFENPKKPIPKGDKFENPKENGKNEESRER